MVEAIEIRPEEAGEYFRELLNEEIRKGDYKRHKGYLRRTDWFEGEDMRHLSDKFNCNAVFYNYNSNHWNYLIDMDDSRTLLYDPIEGLVQETTSEINIRNLIIFPDRFSLEKDYLIGEYFHENHPSEDTLKYLRDLGSIQNNDYDCGPLCIYAVLEAEKIRDDGLEFYDDGLEFHGIKPVKKDDGLEFYD